MVYWDPVGRTEAVCEGSGVEINHTRQITQSQGVSASVVQWQCFVYTEKKKSLMNTTEVGGAELGDRKLTFPAQTRGATYSVMYCTCICAHTYEDVR